MSMDVNMASTSESEKEFGGQQLKNSRKNLTIFSNPLNISNIPNRLVNRIRTKLIASSSLYICGFFFSTSLAICNYYFLWDTQGCTNPWVPMFIPSLSSFARTLFHFIQWLHTMATFSGMGLLQQTAHDFFLFISHVALFPLSLSTSEILQLEDLLPFLSSKYFPL